MNGNPFSKETRNQESRHFPVMIVDGTSIKILTLLETFYGFVYVFTFKNKSTAIQNLPVPLVSHREISPL